MCTYYCQDNDNVKLHYVGLSDISYFNGEITIRRWRQRLRQKAWRKGIVCWTAERLVAPRTGPKMRTVRLGGMFQIPSDLSLTRHFTTPGHYG